MTFALAILVAWLGPVGGPQMDPIESLFVAIEAEEGWNGKPGKAGEHGPLQIQRAYYEDALEQLRREGDPNYERLREPGYPAAVLSLDDAKLLARAYWRRWEPWEYARVASPIGSFEALARCHNGGPQWRTKPPEVRARTAGYWRRVKERL